MKIRDNFKCPNCNNDIKSNEFKILIITFILWFLIIGLAVGLLFSESALLWITTDLLAGVALFIILFVAFIKIELKKKDV